MSVPCCSCYLQTTDHPGSIKAMIFIFQSSCSNCTKAPQPFLSQPWQFRPQICSSLRTTPHPPAVGLCPCPTNPTLGPGASGMELGKGISHIPASCPGDVMKRCPSPWLCPSPWPSVRLTAAITVLAAQGAASEGWARFCPCSTGIA